MSDYMTCLQLTFFDFARSIIVLFVAKIVIFLFNYNMHSIHNCKYMCFRADLLQIQTSPFEIYI